MYKKYIISNKSIERVIVVDDPDTITKRTKAFLQWINFNKKNPTDMAHAIVKNPKMHFLTNCEILIDDSVQCTGKTFKPFCYVWKTEYFDLIVQARKVFWDFMAYMDKKDDNKSKDKK